MQFQSRSGFLMRCDGTNNVTDEFVYFVSIPAGFSDALRRGTYQLKLTSGRVSILVLVDAALRP